MQYISFKSRIRPVGVGDFYKAARTIGERGNACPPWTIRDSAFNKDVFTSGVIDCTVCGITDGKNALLVHICPTLEENKDFKKIADYIKSKLEFMKKEYLQGLILGSQDEETNESRNLFNKFVDLMEKLNIPTSIFRAAEEETHVAYISDKDEWIISTKDVPALLRDRNGEQTIITIFDEVKLSELDEFGE